MIKPTRMSFEPAASDADSISLDAGGLPYQSVPLWGAVVAFVGEFKYPLETLQNFCERFEAEVVAEVQDNPTLLVVGKNAPAIASTVAPNRCSEAALLNLIKVVPTSFTAFVDQLIAQGFDITYRANEGDGFQTTFQWSTELSDVPAALLAYAQQSEVVQAIMAAATHHYSDRQLAKVLADFACLDSQDPQRGWYRFLEAAEFVWNMDAVCDRTIVSGLSLLKTMQACVGDIAVLAIHDQALATSVEAVHLVGGLDSQGQLIGFILHRVWT